MFGSLPEQCHCGDYSNGDRKYNQLPVADPGSVPKLLPTVSHLSILLWCGDISVNQLAFDSVTNNLASGQTGWGQA
jgi:hypothetical protein